MLEPLREQAVDVVIVEGVVDVPAVAARFHKAHAAQQPELMEDLEYVTTYRGKPLENGQKSVTVTLVFRSPTGTLTGEQVDATVQRVVEAAKAELGATLRA